MQFAFHHYVFDQAVTRLAKQMHETATARQKGLAVGQLKSMTWQIEASIVDRHTLRNGAFTRNLTQ